MNDVYIVTVLKICVEVYGPCGHHEGQDDLKKSI